MPLPTVPTELLLHILEYSSPQDLWNIAQTCRRCQSAALEVLPCLRSKDPVYFFENSYPQSFRGDPPKNELLISTPRREATLIPFLRARTLKSVVNLRISPSQGFSGLDLELLGFNITYLSFECVDISTQSFGQLFNGIQALRSFSFRGRLPCGSWNSIKSVLLKYFRATLERLMLHTNILYIGPLIDFKVLKYAEMQSRIVIRQDAVENFYDVFPPSIERVRLTVDSLRGLGNEYPYGHGYAEEFFADIHQLKNHTFYCRSDPDIYVWDKTLPPLASKSFPHRQGDCEMHWPSHRGLCWWDVRRDRRLRLDCMSIERITYNWQWT